MKYALEVTTRLHDALVDFYLSYYFINVFINCGRLSFNVGVTVLHFIFEITAEKISFTYSPALLNIPSNVRI